MNIYSVVSLLWALFVATSGLAQTCKDTLELKPKTAAEAIALWDDNREAGCLGSAQCTTPLCLAVHAQIGKISAGEIPPTPALLIVFHDLEDAGPGPLYSKLRRRISLFLSQIPPDGSLASLNAAQFSIAASQRLFESSKQDLIDFEQYLRTECSSGEKCAQAWREAANVASQSTLFGRILLSGDAPDRKKMVDYLAGLDARWRHYVLGPRAQYPWELLVNGWRFRKTANLVEPPSNQFILAHPSAAFELSSRDKGKAAGALLLEAFGWNSWTWQGNQTKQRFGASAILSWRTSTALAGDKVFGYGAMIHLPYNLSLGYVYRPADLGRHSLVLGADVAKLFTKGMDLRSKLLGGK